MWRKAASAADQSAKRVRKLGRNAAQSPQGRTLGVHVPPKSPDRHITVFRLVVGAVQTLKGATQHQGEKQDPTARLNKARARRQEQGNVSDKSIVCRVAQDERRQKGGSNGVVIR